MQTARLTPAAIKIHRSIDAAAESWRKLEAAGCATLYQSLPWCSAWQATVGESRQNAPCIVVIEAADGGEIAVLPLQIRRRLGITVLEWLGAPHAGYGYGIYAKDFLPNAHRWFADNFARILEEIGGVDAVAMQDMPAALHGSPHPFSRLFNVLGANRSYAMRLESDYEKLYASKRSGETRRSNRKRDQKLAALGQLEFDLPQTPPEICNVLAEMFGHQEKRLAESGVYGVFGAKERAFIGKLAETPGLLAPYRLRLDGKTLAVMLGGIHGGTYWALVSSLAPGPERRYSPGDAALRKTIEACCARGLKIFDFSAGDTSYKPQWADDIIPLHARLAALNLRGLALTIMLAAANGLKGLVKRNQALRRGAMTLRRIARGHAPSDQA
jgi:CelD/BcsL family acetyltransferase involved in cellulose biosynthesis